MPTTLKNLTALSALLNGSRDLYIIIKPDGLIWQAEAYISQEDVECTTTGWILWNSVEKCFSKGVWFLRLSLMVRHL